MHSTNYRISRFTNLKLMLGWDITDFGLGNFDECGFSLITITNGNLSKKNEYPPIK